MEGSHVDRSGGRTLATGLATRTISAGHRDIHSRSRCSPTPHIDSLGRSRPPLIYHQKLVARGYLQTGLRDANGTLANFLVHILQWTTTNQQDVPPGHTVNHLSVVPGRVDRADNAANHLGVLANHHQQHTRDVNFRPKKSVPEYFGVSIDRQRIARGSSAIYRAEIDAAGRRVWKFFRTAREAAVYYDEISLAIYGDAPNGLAGPKPTG